MIKIKKKVYLYIGVILVSFVEIFIINFLILMN